MLAKGRIRLFRILLDRIAPIQKLIISFPYEFSDLTHIFEFGPSMFHGDFSTETAGLAIMYIMVMKISVLR